MLFFFNCNYSTMIFVGAPKAVLTLSLFDLQVNIELNGHNMYYSINIGTICDEIHFWSEETTIKNRYVK